ncbi:hypothetical protein D3C72_2102300 [compost metagenome]
MPIIEEEQIHYHDVWNWESENGAWVIAIQQSGLTQEMIENVFKNREQITNWHPGDAAAIWSKFKHKRLNDRQHPVMRNFQGM